ncbi:MAG: hypothetical protein ACJAYE_002260 [Candidatus Azotimanducaceae bacterium]|jgi:hypothetical protein
MPFEGRRVLVIQNMDGSDRQFAPLGRQNRTRWVHLEI